MEIEETRYNKYGEPIQCLIKGIPVVIDGRFVGGFAMYVDITEIKKKEEEIRYISFHDQMTGLYNRRYFENEMNRLNNSRDLPITIIIADIDGLKEINDNYGHQEGDRYIKISAEIIRSVTRKSDIVARIGGDEFAIVLPATGKRVAAKIVERITEGCQKYNNSGLKFPISISVGFAVKENQNQDLSEIFIAADKNMYTVKRKKKKNIKSNFL